MMRKIWLALILTVSMSVSPVIIWAEDENTEGNQTQENEESSWESFVETVNKNFVSSYKGMKDASEKLKTDKDKKAFIDSMKSCINDEKEALEIYQNQLVGEKESNNNLVKDVYVNGTNKMTEALNAVTEEDLANPESDFWKKWKGGSSKRYDVIMELYYYLGDNSLDEEIIQEIHDKYYKNMILKDDTESISELQNKLGIAADGAIGPGTLYALKTWQQNNNKEIRGVITKKLIDNIENND